MAFCFGVFHCGIACAIHSWLSAKCFHFKAGVVGKHIAVVFVVYVFGFLTCVLFEGSAGLWYVVVAVYVVERQHFKLLSEYISYLVELMLVVCCKHYFHFSFFFTFTFIASNPSP